MRSPPTLGLMLTAAIAVSLSVEHDARAQSFPGEGGTAVWAAMLRGGNPVTDEPRAGAGERDRSPRLRHLPAQVSARGGCVQEHALRST